MHEHGLHFVQLEMDAIDNFRWLTISDKTAAAVLLTLMKYFKPHQAGVVIVARKTIAQDAAMSVPTIDRAIKRLVAGKWISIVKLVGQSHGYAINASVAWFGRRAEIPRANFTAHVVITQEGQSESVIRGEMPRAVDPAGALGFNIETGEVAG